MSAREALSQVDCTKANATGTLRDSCNKDSIHAWTVDLCMKALQEICSTPVSNGTQSDRPSKLEVWGYGGLFVLLVSLSSVVGVFFLPLMKMESYKKVLMGMVGLAVGCLCGSAIFHLIPQAFQLPDETVPELEAYLFKALVIIAAIYAFFLTERLLKLSVDHRKRKKQLSRSRLSGIARESSPGNDTKVYSSSNGGHLEDYGHSHLHDPLKLGNGHGETMSDDSFDETRGQHCSNIHVKIPPSEVRTHQHEHDFDTVELKSHPIKTVAWMVITGDGIHNFVDGLAMGAAFSVSLLEGISVSIAVLCEELPHELGDLAILLNSGMKLKKALLYNFISACTCFIGLIVGILLGGMEEAQTWIFALAGGMFLYISLVDMLPEMTHTAEEASSESFKSGMIMLGIQNVGMLSGFTIMFLLARYARDITFEKT
ncbi:LOW QUALITY PROTEIN: hypothetical protein RvY_13990 [Ramazzottius varieornatus]|uniref:Zinc transporter ZIP14 n=1 Tax=Ramazzottius varieornatus TaxID=947166 RepID=A0A1D1VX52_RAMVA|nr:LOW QUALITY PROTEIN: hypothetical protein RvY_13990 [Ramazzottius varieornatus]